MPSSRLAPRTPLRPCDVAGSALPHRGPKPAPGAAVPSFPRMRDRGERCRRRSSCIGESERFVPGRGARALVGFIPLRLFGWKSLMETRAAGESQAGRATVN